MDEPPLIEFQVNTAPTIRRPPIRGSAEFARTAGDSAPTGRWPTAARPGERWPNKQSAGPCRDGSTGPGRPPLRPPVAAGAGRGRRSPPDEPTWRPGPAGEAIDRAPGFVPAGGRPDHQQPGQLDLPGDGRWVKRALAVQHGQHAASLAGSAGSQQRQRGGAASAAGGQPFHQAAARQASAGKQAVEQRRTAGNRGQAGGAVMLLGAGRWLRPVGPARGRFWGCGASDREKTWGVRVFCGQRRCHEIRPDNVQMYIYASIEQLPCPRQASKLF